MKLLALSLALGGLLSGSLAACEFSDQASMPKSCTHAAAPHAKKKTVAKAKHAAPVASVADASKS